MSGANALALSASLAACLGAGYLLGRIHAGRLLDVAMKIAEERIDLLERKAKKERMLLTTRAQLAESRARALGADLANLAMADAQASRRRRSAKA